MSRRGTHLRRLIKWICTVGVVITLFILGSFVYSRSILLRGGANWMIGTWDGSVLVAWANDPVATTLWPPAWSVSRRYRTLGDLLSAWRQYGLLPSRDFPAAMGLSIPLWMPLIVFGVPSVWMWRRDRRCSRDGCCKRCGYDLTGKVSGACPECGVKT